MRESDAEISGGSLGAVAMIYCKQLLPGGRPEISCKRRNTNDRNSTRLKNRLESDFFKSLTALTGCDRIRIQGKRRPHLEAEIFRFSHSCLVAVFDRMATDKA